MRIAPCNEMIAPMPFPQQCEDAARLGRAQQYFAAAAERMVEAPG